MKPYVACACIAILMQAVTAADGTAETYPSRAVRVIVPYPPGSGLDTVARVTADRLHNRLKQPFTVENRSGASGNIGSEFVFRAAPDGYTLLVAPPTPLVVNKALTPSMNFDPDQFASVSTLASLPNVLLVNSSVRVDSITKLLALARDQPGKLNYASQGTGATPHLAMEYLKSVTGINLTHIPYRGVAPAITALIAGDVQVMFADLATALPQIRANKVKAIAITSEKRHPLLPDVPTVAETLPGFSVTVWYGMVAPPGTISAVVDLLAKTIGEELQTPEIAARLSALSITPVGSTAAAMSAFLALERERWKKVIREANIKPE